MTQLVAKPGTVHIDYQLIANTVGWSRCEVTIGDKTVALTASYLGDALGGLVDAACLVMSGEASAKAEFWEEPGEYRWLIDRVAADARVRVLEFDDLWGGEPDETGRVLLDEPCLVVDFARAVLATADAVLQKHGAAGYKDLWHEHDFPMKSVTWLRELLSEAT